MKKRFLLVSLLTLASAISVAIITSSPIKDAGLIHTNATECTVHEGYHYAFKAPTIDSPGHLEFWTCCICQHQYLVRPEGNFVDQDDAYMTGGIDTNHIAYLPPATEGGENGDYWTNDQFD